MIKEFSFNEFSLNDFYQKQRGVGLVWLGNAGWVINLGGVIFCTDLDLHSPGRVPLPANVDVLELARHIRIAFVTHAHGDHFNEETGGMLAEHSACRFVLPKSCVRTAAEIGLPGDRMTVVAPGMDYALPGLNVHTVRAVHGHLGGSIYSGANFEDCGYIFEGRGLRIYQPGDTVLLEEHFTMRGIDLAFVSPTEHNMHIESAARYLSLLAPRYIFPQHYDSYEVTDDNAFWTRGFADELYGRLPAELRAGFVRARQGQPVCLV